MLEQARQLGRRFLAARAEVQLYTAADPLSMPHGAFIAFVYILVPTMGFGGKLVEVSANDIALSALHVLEMQDLSSLVSDGVRAGLAGTYHAAVA